MCGIAGFTFSDAGRDQHGIARHMLAAIAHRGPDEQGIAVTDGLALAHNRLTIMTPDGGQQPRINGASGNTLIYNGEIYNHRAFDTALRAAGCALRDQCDTETLFWLLETYGIEKALPMLDGMFAFAWYVAGENTLYLARDRFGQKPLFYAEVGGEFVFASEIKALRRHPGLAAVTPDLAALRTYLLMEYAPGPATGFREIHELPAGHLLCLSGGRSEVRPYWQARDAARDAGIDRRTAATTLDGLLNEAVRQQLVADVPLGVFLSGGLDSSMIAAIARRHSDDVATFTVKFPYASFDESQHAEAVARHVGTRHTTIEFDRQNCIEGLQQLLERLDQPFCDSSLLPSYLLSKATRRHVKVAVGGDGADELLLGYPNFRLLRAAKLMAALPAAAGRLLQFVADRLPHSTAYMNRAFLLRQLACGIGRPAHQQSIYWMAPLPPKQQRLLWRDGASATPQRAADGSRALLDQWQLQFIEDYLAYDILPKMDRASMYASLEVRSPFLANAVADFALTLPTEVLLRDATGKQVLRDIARQYLPDATIGRAKHGFGLPVSALLLTDLRELASSLLLDRSNTMYAHINYAAVESLWSEHAERKRDRGKALWALLMLAAFFRNQF